MEAPVTNVSDAQTLLGGPLSFVDDNTFGLAVDVQSVRRSPAMIAIVVASVVALLAVIVVIGTLVASLLLASATTSVECSQLGDGTHRVAGTTYVCSPSGNSAHSNGN
jgi:hypothetical protein